MVVSRIRLAARPQEQQLVHALQLEHLRLELQPLTLSALKKRALALGIPREGVDMVDDTVPTQPPYTFESTRVYH